MTLQKMKPGQWLTTSKKHSSLPGRRKEGGKKRNKKEIEWRMEIGGIGVGLINYNTKVLTVNSLSW